MSKTIKFKLDTEEQPIDIITVEDNESEKIIAKLKFLFAINYTNFSYTTSSDSVMFNFEKWGYDVVNLIKLIKEINEYHAWNAINSVRCSQIDKISAMLDATDIDEEALYALENVREGSIVIFKRDVIKSFKALHLLNIFSLNEEVSYVNNGKVEKFYLHHYRCLHVPEFEYLFKQILKAAN